MNDKNVRSADLLPRNGNLIKILSGQANELLKMRKAACISHSIKCRLLETQDQGHPMPAAILVYAALLLGSTSAVASANSDILFYCQTANGKQVHIQQHDGNVRYRFGKNLAPPNWNSRNPKRRFTSGTSRSRTTATAPTQDKCGCTTAMRTMSPPCFTFQKEGCIRWAYTMTANMPKFLADGDTPLKT